MSVEGDGFAHTYPNHEGVLVPISGFEKKFIEKIGRFGVGSACDYNEIFLRMPKDDTINAANKLLLEINSLLGSDNYILFQNIARRQVMVGASMTVKANKVALQKAGIFPEEVDPICPEHARPVAEPCLRVRRLG